MDDTRRSEVPRDDDGLDCATILELTRDALTEDPDMSDAKLGLMVRRAVDDHVDRDDLHTAHYQSTIWQVRSILQPKKKHPFVPHKERKKRREADVAEFRKALHEQFVLGRRLGSYSCGECKLMEGGWARLGNLGRPEQTLDEFDELTLRKALRIGKRGKFKYKKRK